MKRLFTILSMGLLCFAQQSFGQYVGQGNIAGRINIATGSYGPTILNDIYPFGTSITSATVQAEVYFDNGGATDQKTATAGSQTTATLYWAVNGAVSNINSDGTGGSGWTAVNGTNHAQVGNNDQFDFVITGVTAGTDIMYYMRFAQTTQPLNRYLHFAGTGSPYTALPTNQNQMFKMRFNASTTYNAKRIEGNFSDWQANELIHTSASRDWYVTWDATYIYVRLANLGGNSDRINIGIDTDPGTLYNSDVSSFSGHTFRGYLTPEYIVQSLNTGNLDVYPRSGTGWGTSSNIYGSGSNLWRSGGDAELRIPRSNVGLTSTSNTFALYCWISNSGDTPYTTFITDNPIGGRMRSASVWINSDTGTVVNTSDFTDHNNSETRTLSITSGFRNLYVSNGTANINLSTALTGDVTVATSATLALTGGGGNDLRVGGNFTNNGTFTDNTRATFFNGTAGEQTIGGTTSTTFSYLIIDKASGGGNVKLTNNINVTTSVDLDNASNTADVDLNGFNITLGASASVVEDLAGNKIIKDGIATSESTKGGALIFPSTTVDGASTNLRGSGLYLQTTGSSYNVTFTRQHYRGGGMNGGGGIKRIYQISGTPTASTTLRIYYATDELAGITIDANTVLFRWTSANGWLKAGDASAGFSNGTNGSGYIEATDVTAFSDWTVGSTTAPLPISLLTFAGKKLNDKQALLTWTTATETNNKGFYIEKSSNATNFQTIAFIEGANNSTAIKQYNFTDVSFQASAYYRLRQMDFNGETSYSPLIFVENEVFSVYPNPIADNITLNLPIADTETVQIVLTNATGKLVKQLTVTAKNASIHLSEKLKGLPEGLYILTIRTPTKTWTERIIKR